MTDRQIEAFKYLTLILTFNIAFQLISDATAGKLIFLFGVGVSVTVLYFPFTYIISDIVTEVYGYAKARMILWYTLFASILAGLIYQIAVAIPPAPFFDDNDAYATVFGIVPRVLIGGWLAVFLGDIVNNYALAKLKLITHGRLLWMRTITSTILGQGVNTSVFYLIALSGVLPSSQLLHAILISWLVKIIVEAAMTPVTYMVTSWLKQKENIDHYDRETNFNPFKINTTNVD